ncbi:MAG: sigma-70 family RNA polymerase sigma factor [Prevotella sp.]|nr:sigma-70 family RNA polymerase sigma factor [Prevotella sp.]
MTKLSDFYDYISNNYEQSRHEVMKNITYDSELFDDAYNDTVVKVAKVIEDGKKIEDIRYYFFISLKWNYINMQNKKRKQLSRTTDVMPDAMDDEYSEERYEKVMELWDFIAQRLEENFEPGEVDIYLIYYKLKCNGNSLSYRKLSEMTGIPVKEITNIIQRIKKYVRNNDEINELKKKLLC